MIDMRLVMLLATALALAAPPAVAGPYCHPVNGRDQITKAGSACPVGYFATDIAVSRSMSIPPRHSRGSPVAHVRPGRSPALATIACHCGSRARTRCTCTACHRPPRGVGIP